MGKYSYEKIEENKSYVWHTEGDIKTLVAITDNLEKAHFLATAANGFNESPEPSKDVELEARKYAGENWPIKTEEKYYKGDVDEPYYDYSSRNAVIQQCIKNAYIKGATQWAEQVTKATTDK